MQAVYVLFRDDNVMKLPYFIAIAGFVCALFAVGIPHLSALRIWLGFSTFFSLVYIITAVVLSLRDGKHGIFLCQMWFLMETYVIATVNLFLLGKEDNVNANFGDGDAKMCQFYVTLQVRSDTCNTNYLSPFI